MFGLTSKPVMGKANADVGKHVAVIFASVGRRLFENYAKWSPEVETLEPLTEAPIGEAHERARYASIGAGAPCRSSPLRTFTPTAHFAHGGDCPLPIVV
jgi:hypothetical protein